MNKNLNIFKEKNTRPQSSNSFRNLPNILMIKKNKPSYPIIESNLKEENFDFNINLIPKIEAENIYKDNFDLKEKIKELKKKIDFYKTNNQKLSQSISQKNREINELTNQLILKNKELMTNEKKQKLKKDKDITINSENILEEKIKIKKLNNEINAIKEEMHKLKLILLQRDEEILELKKNKKITDYQELKIKYETLLDEFNKLRNRKLINSDKNYFLCLENDKKFRNEIQILNDIILGLNVEKDKYYLERKKLMDEIKDLKNKLELANNNSKLMKNKKKLYEEKYKKNIKEQVLIKEYEEEKKEMIDKINKLQKKLDYYMLNAVKNKEYVINKTNSKIKNEENKNNFASNEIRKNIISVKNVTNPEENYDNKILLMQSLITELTNENKELLEKTKNYEIKINSLLQTNKEILNSNMGLDNIFVSNSAMNNENQQKNENDKKEEKNKDETESISKDDEDQ